jgi:hypothetical protein
MSLLLFRLAQWACADAERGSNPCPAQTASAASSGPSVSFYFFPTRVYLINELLMPEPLIPKHLIPEPLIPEPLIPEPLIPEPLINEH